LGPLGALFTGGIGKNEEADPAALLRVWVDSGGWDLWHSWIEEFIYRDGSGLGGA